MRRRTRCALQPPGAATAPSSSMLPAAAPAGLAARLDGAAAGCWRERVGTTVSSTGLHTAVVPGVMRPTVSVCQHSALSPANKQIWGCMPPPEHALQSSDIVSKELPAEAVQPKQLQCQHFMLVNNNTQEAPALCTCASGGA